MTGFRWLFCTASGKLRGVSIVKNGAWHREETYPSFPLTAPVSRPADAEHEDGDKYYNSYPRPKFVRGWVSHPTWTEENDVPIIANLAVMNRVKSSSGDRTKI